MKPIGKLNQDVKEVDLTNGDSPFRKNVVLNEKLGSIVNERGHSIITDLTYTPIGIIEADSFFVLFETDNTNSIIGVFNDSDNNLVIGNTVITPQNYTVIVNRTDLGFNLDYPIVGEYYKAFNSQIVISFTDDYNNVRYINLSDYQATDNIRKLSLFPLSNSAMFSNILVEAGGTVTDATYLLISRYYNLDGSFTNWQIFSDPIYVARGTGSRITFTISNIDVTYDKIDIAIVAITSTSTTVKDIYKVPVSSIPLTLLYDGTQDTGVILVLDDILVNTINYRIAKAITQLNNTLFIGNLSVNDNIDFQPYANSISLKYQLKIHRDRIDNDCLRAPYDVTKSYNIPKTLPHNEVVAIYISFILKNGSMSRLFHIPGRAVRNTTIGSNSYLENIAIPNIALTDDAYLQSNDAFIDTSTTIRYFQTRDTCDKPFTIADNTTQSPAVVYTNTGNGLLSYWENKDEFYPNTPDFNGSISGPNLVGQPIRHHKMPSHNFIKNNCFSTNSTIDNSYMVSMMDRLELVADNIVIPADIQSQIQGYQFFFAERTQTNSTIISQGLWSFASGTISSQANLVNYTSGGNWDSLVETTGTYAITDALSVGGVNNEFNYLQKTSNYIRGHFFENNQFNLNTQQKLFISNQFVLGKDSCVKYCNLPLGLFGSTSGSTSSPYGGSNVELFREYLRWIYVDYLSSKSNTLTTPVNYIRPVTVGVTVENAGITLSALAALQLDNRWAEKTTFIDFLGSSLAAEIAYDYTAIYFKPNAGVDDTYLGGYISSNAYSYLIKHLDNCYYLYTQQNCCPFNGWYSCNASGLQPTQIISGGDSFIGTYDFRTSTPRFWGENDPSRGLRCTFYHLLESSLNVFARFPVLNNSYTYVASRLAPNLPTSYISGYSDNFYSNSNANGWNFEGLSEPNTLLTFLSPYNTEVPIVSSFPYRVIKSQRQESDSISTNWRVFLPLDYYEMPKNKGEIINLQGWGIDRLLIHHESSLFITRSIGRIETNITAATLGTGDIFSFPPEEIVPTSLGYAGTQNQLACKITPYGYFFTDASIGTIFQFNGNSCEPIINGMRLFTRDYLKPNLNSTPNRFKIDNPYNANGITLGYDRYNYRILISVKNEEQSFTLSYLPDSKQFVSFHDYIPNNFINTKNDLFSVHKDGDDISRIYKHQNNAVGKFYKNSTIQQIYPSIIDLSISNEDSFILDSVEFTTQVESNSNNDYDQFLKTYTQIHIRNNYQGSGLVTLDDTTLLNITGANNRNAETTWRFNSFRDITKKNVKFVESVFNNFIIDPAQIDTNLSWYQKRLFNNKYHIVRLQYDNATNTFIYLNDVDFKVRPSFR